MPAITPLITYTGNAKRGNDLKRIFPNTATKSIKTIRDTIITKLWQTLYNMCLVLMTNLAANSLRLALTKFADLEKQRKEVRESLNVFGRSVDSLREKLNLL